MCGFGVFIYYCFGIRYIFSLSHWICLSTEWANSAYASDFCTRTSILVYVWRWTFWKCILWSPTTFGHCTWTVLDGGRRPQHTKFWTNAQIFWRELNTYTQIRLTLKNGCARAREFARSSTVACLTVAVRPIRQTICLYIILHTHTGEPDGPLCGRVVVL